MSRRRRRLQVNDRIEVARRINLKDRGGNALLPEGSRATVEAIDSGAFVLRFDRMPHRTVRLRAVSFRWI